MKGPSCSALPITRVKHYKSENKDNINFLTVDILNSFVSEKEDDLDTGIFCNCPENCNDVVYSQEISILY